MVCQIDIDNTVTTNPDFFRWFTVALKRDNHMVLIVSSRTTSKENLKATAEELRGYGIVYDKLILSPEVEDLDQSRLPRFLHPAHRQFISKVFVAEDHRVDILFDDCSITGTLFERYLPSVKVFRPIRHR